MIADVRSYVWLEWVFARAAVGAGVQELFRFIQRLKEYGLTQATQDRKSRDWDCDDDYEKDDLVDAKRSLSITRADIVPSPAKQYRPIS